MKKREDFQDRALARLLTAQGVPSDYEQRAGRKQMDVVATVDGLRVVLKAETGIHRHRSRPNRIAQLLVQLAARATAAAFPPNNGGRSAPPD